MAVSPRWHNRHQRPEVRSFSSSSVIRVRPYMLGRSDTNVSSQYQVLEQEDEIPITRHHSHLSEPTDSPLSTTTAKLSVRETAEIAAWWSAVWFIANWTVNASLGLTSVASVTILSSTSGESFHRVSYLTASRSLFWLCGRSIRSTCSGI
jgi:hypothetical protein